MSTRSILGVLCAAALGSLQCLGPLGTEPRPVTLQQRLHDFPRQNLPLSEPASIYWDDHLIPFIVAKNDSDCAFLLGMVHAHLRLGQMTLMRRAAQGRLSESVGPLAAGVDFSLRILDIGRAVDSIKLILPARTRDWLGCYIKGLNFYQEHMKSRPLEWQLMAIQPEPWRLEDLLAIGRLMGADVNWFNWFSWLPLQDKPYFPELWQRFVTLGYASTPSFGGDPLATLIPTAWKSGSNALVISARRSTDSSALLASDPHLGLQLPNMWLIAGYRCPSFQVVGLMFPGIPMVLVGRNSQIAWAGTNMRAASSDLYLMPATQTATLTSRKEKIKIRWWPDREVTIRSAPAGPILSDSPLLKTKKGQILALKWLGHSASDEMTAFLDVNRAQDWQEFYHAFSTYAVSGQNFVYADHQGHIGMTLAVRVPARSKEYQPRLVLDALDSTAIWNGTLTFGQLPAVLDPACGFIASANNRPVVMEPPIGYFFSANDRIERMQEMLAADSSMSLSALEKMQRDVHVASALRLRDALLARMSKLHEPLPSQTREVLKTLRGWDGDYRADSRGPVAIQLVAYHVMEGYYSHKYDPRVAALLRSSEQANVMLTADIEADSSQLMGAILRHAVIRAAKDFKKFPDWGSMHRLILAHPFANLPFIGSRFRFGDYPADGSYNTLMKTAHTIQNQRHSTFYGANSRFITRVKNPDDNYLVLLGGEDGWIGSPGLVDQVELWRQGRYIRVPLTLDSVRTYFRNHMALQPTRP